MRAGTTIVPRLVTREEWGAAPPTKVTLQKLPIEQVWFSYNIGEMSCAGDDECFKVLRDYQKQFMDKGLSDIPYNFLVGGDGTVYEGRGWHRKSSATLGPIYTSKVDIAFIGDFERNSLEMIDAGYEHAYYGVDNGFVSKRFKMVEQHNGLKEQLEAKCKEADKKKAERLALGKDDLEKILYKRIPK